MEFKIFKKVNLIFLCCVGFFVKNYTKGHCSARSLKTNVVQMPEVHLLTSSCFEKYVNKNSFAKERGL